MRIVCFAAVRRAAAMKACGGRTATTQGVAPNSERAPAAWQPRASASGGQPCYILPYNRIVQFVSPLFAVL